MVAAGAGAAVALDGAAVALAGAAVATRSCVEAGCVFEELEGAERLAGLPAVAAEVGATEAAGPAVARCAAPLVTIALLVTAVGC